MESLHDIATKAAHEAMVEELKLQPRETHVAFYQWLLSMRQEHRVYFFTVDMVRNQIWPALRENEVILDMVFRATIGFYTRMTETTGHPLYDQYCERLADVMGGMTNVDNSVLMVTDAVFAEKLPPKREITALLERERWLCFILTLERCATHLVPAKLLEPLDPPVKRTGRN